jgi:cytidylate kinase
MVSLFILADRHAKVDRITKLYNKTEKEALAMMNTHDKYRKQYHNEHCPGKWGDSRNYELSINSSKLGVDETIKIISAYIDARRQ